MKNRLLYVGLDVHKNTTDVATATGRSNGKVRFYGKISSSPDALNRLIKKLQDGDKQLRFVYEAGPCGYQIYRHLNTKGIDCDVVAPSMIPRRSGVRIKTDRRDAINLVRLFRAGELTSIYIPSPEDEAIRDLIRCRDDIRRMERKACQQLLSFCCAMDINTRGRKIGLKPFITGWRQFVFLTRPSR